MEHTGKTKSGDVQNMPGGHLSAWCVLAFKCFPLNIPLIFSIFFIYKCLLYIMCCYTFLSSTGKLTDMHGNAYRYNADVKHMNSAGVLATLRDHQYYLSRVPQNVLQDLN